MSGLMFKPDLALAVVDGRKTQTRRALSDNPRSPWWKEKCALRTGVTRAIVPGRGRPSIARVRVDGVRKARILDITERDAVAEGFRRHNGIPAREAFLDRYLALNPFTDHDDECWVIEFHLISSTPALVNNLRREVEMNQDGIHTIPVPTDWTPEQAWEAIARGDLLTDPDPSWANVEVKDGKLHRVLPAGGPA